MHQEAATAVHLVHHVCRVSVVGQTDPIITMMPYIIVSTVPTFKFCKKKEFETLVCGMHHHPQTHVGLHPREPMKSRETSQLANDGIG